MQAKIASESDLLSAGFPDQTIVLLSNLLAGVTAMLNYSQVTRDLNNFTPFAFLKSAGYAIAGTLGVSPARKRGASQTVVFTSGDNQPDFSKQLSVPITIPAYTQFACRSLVWHTREDYLINPADLSVEFQLYEGVINTVNFVSNGEKYQRWLIGTQYSVDQNTLRVLIDNNWWTIGSGTFVKYLASDEIFIPTTSPDGRVLILFGNGIYGVIPPNNSTIKVYYTVTVGSQGNSASVGDPVFLMDIVSISAGVALALSGTTTTVASGGMEEDDLDSIKYVTPRLYASNERSVRRDDYIGQLLGPDCPVAMMDARAWGEYEQARLVGLGTVEMMNRAFWGGVLATAQPYVNDGLGASAVDGVATRFTFTLFHTDDPTGPSPFPISGSLLVFSTDAASSNIVFSDLDGYGILTSPLISRDYLRTSGVVAQATSDSGVTVGNVIDGNPDTAWQSADLPMAGSPVFVGMTLPVPQIPASFRLRASNDMSVDTRAFPASVSVWGSNNPTPPSMLDQTLWIPIRGNVYPDDPGVEGESSWYCLDNTVAYQYLLFQINDRNGNNPYTKLSEIEVQILPQSSTIDYQSAQVVIDYGTLPPPALGSSFTAQFYADDLSPEQQIAVQNFILDTNHFTTQFTFSSVRMVRADLSLQVYYNPAYSRNTILNNVSKALRNLLAVKKGSISRSRKFSDLTGAVTSVTGVDYCVFLNPPNGQDIDCEIDQYVYLTSLTIEMIISDRAQIK
jgi:hypothetical protein